MFYIKILILLMAAFILAACGGGGDSSSDSPGSITAPPPSEVSQPLAQIDIVEPIVSSSPSVSQSEQLGNASVNIPQRVSSPSSLNSDNYVFDEQGNAYLRPDNLCDSSELRVDISGVEPTFICPVVMDVRGLIFSNVNTELDINTEIDFEEYLQFTITGESPIIGDIDNDTSITISDLLYFENCIGGLVNTGPCISVEIDFNQDGLVDSSDLNELVLIVEEAILKQSPCDYTFSNESLNQQDLAWYTIHFLNGGLYSTASFQRCEGMLGQTVNGVIEHDDLIALASYLAKPVLGDLDADNEIGATSDLLLLEQHLQGEVVLSNTQFSAADINLDGAVDVVDSCLLESRGLATCVAL